MTKQRSKGFLKQTKPKQKKEQKLETADDYQAAGVDFEEAAGKWRAGDPTKSMRFFKRAIDVYSEGLQKFPQNFDLAYNKARVQLEVATHPILIEQLESSGFDALQVALESHRYALHLNGHDADTLFNTSQVLSSIAESISQDGSPQPALDLLEEAVKLQNECLAIQDAQYTEGLEMMKRQEQENTAHGCAGEVGNTGQNEPENAQPGSEDQWVTIVEPVTLDTLIDTALAQLAVLTTFCDVLTGYPPGAMLLSSVEKHWIALEQKLGVLSNNLPERAQEIALARASFISALLDAGCIHGRIDGAAYKKGRDAAFDVDTLKLGTSVLALHANAQSLLSFNSTVAAIAPEDKPIMTMRWNALTTCISNMTAASNLKGANEEEVDWIRDYRDELHHIRGDATMALYTMGHPPTSYPTAIAQGAQLLQFAEVHYRNAAKLAPRSRRDENEFRSQVAAGLLHGGVDLKIVDSIVRASSKGAEWAAQQFRDMAAEGELIPASLRGY